LLAVIFLSVLCVLCGKKLQDLIKGMLPGD
jgi:hypothetical protein